MQIALPGSRVWIKPVKCPPASLQAACPHAWQRSCASQCWWHGDRHLTSELGWGTLPTIEYLAHIPPPIPGMAPWPHLSDPSQVSVKHSCIGKADLSAWYALYLSLHIFQPLPPTPAVFLDHEFPESKKYASSFCVVPDITWVHTCLSNTR